MNRPAAAAADLEMVGGASADSAVHLSAIVLAYELAQRNRVATGELIRSLLQGRCAGRSAVMVANGSVEATLRAIRAGTVRGPAPALGELYHRESLVEKECAHAMELAVARHLAWPWLAGVRGVGPTLAARLLARLRLDRAATPSSFWSYCGLATVEGSRYCCSVCGGVVTAPKHRTAPRRHVTPSGGACTGTLARDDTGAVRVAARLPCHGERRSFDGTARTICHLIGTSFLRRGGPYREVYYGQRARLESRVPRWTPLHAHRSAMRVMQKLFLAHLWEEWSARAASTARRPYEVARRGRAGVVISASSMRG